MDDFQWQDLDRKFHVDIRPTRNGSVEVQRPDDLVIGSVKAVHGIGWNAYNDVAALHLHGTGGFEQRVFGKNTLVGRCVGAAPIGSFFPATQMDCELLDPLNASRKRK